MLYILLCELILNIKLCIIQYLQLLIPDCEIIVEHGLNKHIGLVLDSYTLFLKQVYMDYYINISEYIFIVIGRCKS